MYINIEKTTKLIQEKECDAVILFNESNMHYLCSFSPSEGVIIITKNGNSYHIVDSRYTETAQIHAQKTGLKVIEIKNSFLNEVNDIVNKENIKKLLFENETISLAQYNSYAKKLNNTEFVELNHDFMLMRNKKEAFEIELMKKANNIAEKSFLELLNEVKIGKTEKELAALFDYIMARNGSEGVSFDTILLTGTHTSMPHGVPSDKKIKDGDFVLFDFGATYQGYHSDMTRTIFVGEPTEEMKKVYDLVLNNQKFALDQYKDGANARQITKMVESNFKLNGGYDLIHSLGHGVGLEIHELPYMSYRFDTMLRENMVVTDEPGIYIPGKFGVRIEDTVQITKFGCISLTNSEKNYIII